MTNKLSGSPPARAFLQYFMALVSALLIICLSGCLDARTGDPTIREDETPDASPVETTDVPAAVAPTVQDDEGLSTHMGPQETKTPVETETPGTSPTKTGDPYVPKQQTPADDEFFADAAFVGNSLVDGFRMFSGLTTCDVYASTSMTVVGAASTASIPLNSGGSGTILQALEQETYGKIYILLGINEIGYDSQYFKGLYSGMVDQIADIQPEADIYIMGLTPVSLHKSSTNTTFTMSRVREYNERLYEIAQEKGCYYIDLCEALAGDDGYLPSDVTTDGVHFNASEYKVWLEYLRYHYI